MKRLPGSRTIRDLMITFSRGSFQRLHRTLRRLHLERCSVRGYRHGVSAAPRRYRSRRSSPTKLWTTSWTAAQHSTCWATSKLTSSHGRRRRCTLPNNRTSPSWPSITNWSGAWPGRQGRSWRVPNSQRGTGTLWRKTQRPRSGAKKALARCRASPARVRAVRGSLELSCGPAHWAKWW